MLEARVRLRRPGFDLDASLAAAAGVTAVFGPSGSGKTTLARAVAGLSRPDSGRIVLDGRVLWDEATDVPPHLRGIGTVFQDARLLPHREVRANLLYGAPDATGLDEVVDLLELRPLLDRRPTRLSGGEAARVALGRALLTRPRLIVLDEPLASLDARLREAILPYLQRLRSTGVPMLLITHAADEVVRLADRVAFIAEGRIVDTGTLDEVLWAPERAARLGAGQAGVLLDGTGDGTGVDTALGRLPLPVEGPARVRVRARDVMLADGPVAVAGRLSIPIVVEEVRDGVAVLDAGGTRLLAEVGASPVDAARVAVLRGELVG